MKRVRGISSHRLLVLVLLMGMLQGLSAASEGVVIREGVIINQPGQNTTFNSSRDFNVSTLVVRNNTTTFDGSNLTVETAGRTGVTVFIDFFNSTSPPKRFVTNFTARPNQSDTVNVSLSNLSTYDPYEARRNQTFTVKDAEADAAGGFFFVQTFDTRQNFSVWNDYKTDRFLAQTLNLDEQRFGQYTAVRATEDTLSLASDEDSLYRAIRPFDASVGLLLSADRTFLGSRLQSLTATVAEAFGSPNRLVQLARTTVERYVVRTGTEKQRVLDRFKATGITTGTVLSRTLGLERTLTVPVTLTQGLARGFTGVRLVGSSLGISETTVGHRLVVRTTETVLPFTATVSRTAGVSRILDQTVSYFYAPDLTWTTRGQAGWNRGVFNGTSADRRDNSGLLGIGYRNSSGTGLQRSRRGLWRLDRSVTGAGGFVRDYTGAGNDGTTQNGVLTGHPGVFSTDAFEFDGINDYVVVPDTASLDISEEITFGGWVYVNSFAGSPQHFIISKYDFDTSGYSMTMEDNGDGTGELRIDINTDTFSEPWKTGLDISEGGWHHIIATFNGTRITAYVDGSAAANTSWNGSILTNNMDLHLGTPADAAGSTTYTLDGVLDEALVYNRSLSAAEVRQLYFHGTPFRGNHSRVLDTSREQRWEELRVNASIPAGTALTAVVEARTDQGDTHDTAIISLNDGLQSYPIDVGNSEDLRLILNGSTGDPTTSWEVESATVHYSPARGIERTYNGSRRFISVHRIGTTLPVQRILGKTVGATVSQTTDLARTVSGTRVISAVTDITGSIARTLALGRSLPSTLNIITPLARTFQGIRGVEQGVDIDTATTISSILERGTAQEFTVGGQVLRTFTGVRLLGDAYRIVDGTLPTRRAGRTRSTDITATTALSRTLVYGRIVGEALDVVGGRLRGTTAGRSIATLFPVTGSTTRVFDGARSLQERVTTRNAVSLLRHTGRAFIQRIVYGDVLERSFVGTRAVGLFIPYEDEPGEAVSLERGLDAVYGVIPRIDRVFSGQRLVQNTAGYAATTMSREFVAKTVTETYRGTIETVRTFTGSRLVSASYTVLTGSERMFAGTRSLPGILSFDAEHAGFRSITKYLEQALTVEDSLHRSARVERTLEQVFPATGTLFRTFGGFRSAGDGIAVTGQFVLGRILGRDRGLDIGVVEVVGRAGVFSRRLSSMFGQETDVSRILGVERQRSPGLSVSSFISRSFTGQRLLGSGVEVADGIFRENTLTRLSTLITAVASSTTRRTLTLRDAGTVLGYTGNVVRQIGIARSLMQPLTVLFPASRSFVGTRLVDEAVSVTEQRQGVRLVQKMLSQLVRPESVVTRTAGYDRGLFATDALIDVGSRTVRQLRYTRTVDTSFRFLEFFSFLIPGGGGDQSGGGDDTGGSSGGGGGGVPPEPFLDVEHLTKEVVIKQPPGSTSTVGVRFRNNGTGEGPLTLRIRDLERFTIPDRSTHTLAPGVSASTNITIEVPEGQPPDVYTGQIAVTAGSHTRTIPLSIIVPRQDERERLNVTLALDTTRITPEDRMRYTLDVLNMGTAQRVDLTLTTTLTAENGTVFRNTTEARTVQTSYSADQLVERSLPPGEYQLAVTARYANRSATSRQTFTVEAPEEPPTTPDLLLPLLFLAGALAVAGLIAQLYRSGRLSGLLQHDAERPDQYRYEDGQTHRCGTCGATFRSATAARLHQSRHRLEAAVGAAGAKTASPTGRQRERAERGGGSRTSRVHVEDQHHCEQCGATFPTQQHLQVHRNREHGKER